MQQNLVLSRQSGLNEIKRYFNNVSKLATEGAEYPVSFDDVWMLAFPDRTTAIRWLRENFMDNFDYISFSSTDIDVDENKKGIDFRLSISCMEYFVVHKFRPVFEIYCDVFHQSAIRAVNVKNLSRGKLEISLHAKYSEPEIKIKGSVLSNDNSIAGKEFGDYVDSNITNIRYSPIVEFIQRNKLPIIPKDYPKYGRLASSLCKQHGVSPFRINSIQFGYVNAYPEFILHLLFSNQFYSSTQSC